MNSRLHTTHPRLLFNKNDYVYMGCNNQITDLVLNKTRFQLRCIHVYNNKTKTGILHVLIQLLLATKNALIWSKVIRKHCLHGSVLFRMLS